MDHRPKWHNRLMKDQRHPAYERPKKDVKKQDDKFNYDTSSK